MFQKSAEYPTLCENFLVTVDEEKIFDILVRLLSEATVKSAAPNYRYSMGEPISFDTIDAISEMQMNINSAAIETAYDSNDQWALDKIGLQDAWDKGFMGSDSIKIGVLDTGIDIDHPDLQDNVSQTLAYNAMTGQRGIQYVDDIHGHGTKVAGVIAADINQIGISGACPNITLVPIKIGDGSYTLEHVVNAIVYAFDKSIPILNFSYTLANNAYAEFAEYIELWNGIFVVAAGNNDVLIEQSSGDRGKMNDDPNWIVVGASTSSDARWSGDEYGSNYCPRYCDLFAPGATIRTTRNDGAYGNSSGTSLAAPYVAAAIALIKAQTPHHTYLEVKELLLNNVQVIEGFENLCVAGGQLNLTNVIDDLFAENRGAYTLGDLNGDGRVKAQDYMMAKRAVLGTYTLSAVQENAADVNQDSVINAQDYMMIERFALGTYYFPPY